MLHIFISLIIMLFVGTLISVAGLPLALFLISFCYCSCFYVKTDLTSLSIYHIIIVMISTCLICLLFTLSCRFRKLHKNKYGMNEMLCYVTLMVLIALSLCSFSIVYDIYIVVMITGICVITLLISIRVSLLLRPIECKQETMIIRRIKHG